MITATATYLLLFCKDSIINKGCPVGFIITNKENSEPVASWLRWLKDEIGFVPRKSMIDCSPVEMKAIYDIYGNSVRALFCHWHIKRLWELNILKLVKSGTEDTQVTKQLQDQARGSLDSLMDCQSIQEFDKVWKYIARSE